MENESIRILVCDDEIDVREMVQEYLAKRGFNVSTAANGEELRAGAFIGGHRFGHS